MITFTFKYLKPIALFLAIVVLFQCCMVYQKEAKTLEEAIGPEKKKVQIITFDDRKLFFDSIYFKDEKLYGLMNRNENLHKKTEVEIIIESIKEIHLLDKIKSRNRTIVLGIVSGSIILIIGSCIYIGISMNRKIEKGADRFEDWLKNNPIIL